MTVALEHESAEATLADAASRYGMAMSDAIRTNPNADVNRYLTDPLRRYLMAGGKRMRPMFCELGCALVGGERSNARSAAEAFESFHTAALIHDDIEDASFLRRGQPALHVTEGVSEAINIGDYGLALVFKLVLDDPSLSDFVKLRCLREFTDMAATTIEGQAIDIGWARDGRFDMTVEDCLYVCEAKTAVYSCAAPLAIGAVIGGASNAQVEQLRQIGKDVGIAFQLRDDLLNINGDESKTGKERYSDLLERKRTVIVAYALQHSVHAEELRELLASSSCDIDTILRMVDIVKDSGALEYTRFLAEELCDRAAVELVMGFDESPARRELEQLIIYVRERTR